MQKIKVVDLFAGPGGLGEGFARFSPDGKPESRPFEIVYSAEKDPAAVKTLRLRTFFRLCETRGAVPNSYYEYLRGKREQPFDTSSERLWRLSCQEAVTTKLGTSLGDNALRTALARHLVPGDDWILIGGPPCQAYSLVGRSRNRGIADYVPEKDTRNFLYEHYLEILARHQPVAFVMENVKGLLSSRVGNEQMFPRILKDLANPGKSAGTRTRPRYTIHALSSQSCFTDGDDVGALDPRDFVVRSEEHGVPQARHRVILIGIRDDSGIAAPDPVQPMAHPLEADAALGTLQPLRSGLTGGPVTTHEWKQKVLDTLKSVERAGLSPSIARRMRRAFKSKPTLQQNLTKGGRFHRVDYMRKGQNIKEKWFLDSIIDERCRGFLNHEARNHMPMDLIRYLFASTWAAERNTSPKASEYPTALAPNHKNWNTGKFVDRFRVQLPSRPSTTITSHIAKDGHYFIHPEPYQCRSLTVREAARLQTFPDNYFFEGNRTQQYIQVGNAVPPGLAHSIAKYIHEAFGTS